MSKTRILSLGSLKETCAPAFVASADPRTGDVGRCHSDANEQKQDLNVKNALHSEILKSEKTAIAILKTVLHHISRRKINTEKGGNKDGQSLQNSAPLSPQGSARFLRLAMPVSPYHQLC